MSDDNANKSVGDFSTRLREVMRLYGFEKIADLARALGHERSENLSRVMRNPKAKPGVDVVADLAEKFDDLNLTWFLTGRGSPLRIPAIDAIEEVKGQMRSLVSAVSFPRIDLPDSADVRPPRRPPSPTQAVEQTLQEPPFVPFVLHTPGEGNIVMLDSQAAAGWAANPGGQELLASQPRFSLPGQQFRGSGLVAVQVVGESMEPTILHHDWLIARRLERPLEELREGHLHLLVTREGCVAKRLFRTQGKAFLCKSDNEAYPPYEVAVEDGDQVYRALAVLSENLSNRADGLHARIVALEKGLMAVQARLKGR